MALTAGKKTSLAKEALRELREIYDAVLDPWLGGKSSASAPPDADLEAQAAVWMPLLRRLYQQALDSYRSALAERQALDFDDLEAGALALLQIPSVAARWQAETAAVLVDEFQDTNDRQRQIGAGPVRRAARAAVRGGRRAPEHLPLQRRGCDRLYRPAAPGGPARRAADRPRPHLPRPPRAAGCDRQPAGWGDGRPARPRAALLRALRPARLAARPARRAASRRRMSSACWARGPTASADARRWRARWPSA